MNPALDDAASLERLHDIVLPPPVSWWPDTAAWYVLAGLLAAFIVIVMAMLIDSWRRNAYRRAGLAELAQLESRSNDPESLRLLAELVKRVALAVYPRERVAALTGQPWLRFLDASGNTRDFTTGAGQRLEASYEPGEHHLSPELLQVVRHWIKHHRGDTQ